MAQAEQVEENDLAALAMAVVRFLDAIVCLSV
jgi:hypothetical protein